MIDKEAMDVSSTPQVRDASSRIPDDHAQQADAPDDIEIDVQEQEPPKPVLFVVHSRTMKLENGFQPIAPPDEGQPHPFTQHNVQDADWAKFLSDLQESAKYMAKPHAREPPSFCFPRLSPFADCEVAGISSLPGLMSALNLGEDAVQDAPAPPLSGVHPVTVIEMWNEHYFQPRGLDISLAKGAYRLSGDKATPPPDMPHMPTPFGDHPFGPDFPPPPYPPPPFPPHGFPYPSPGMPPHIPSPGGMPPPPMPPTGNVSPPPPAPPMDDMPPMPGSMPPHPFMSPRGQFPPMFGRGGLTSPRGHGPIGRSGGRGRGHHTGAGDRGGFGPRGRGGHRGRGGFGHFGFHGHHGPQFDPFGAHNSFFGYEDFDPASYDYCDFDDDEPADLYGGEEEVNKAGRERSHSVSSDSSTSTMSGDEKIKQDKGKEPEKDEKHDSKGHRRGFKDHRHHHHHHGHDQPGARRERGHRHGCRRARGDAESAWRHNFMRGTFMRGHGHGFGRGGFMGRGGRHHHHRFPTPFHFADDGYFRLIVVDNSA